MNNNNYWVRHCKTPGCNSLPVPLSDYCKDCKKFSKKTHKEFLEDIEEIQSLQHQTKESFAEKQRSEKQ